MKKKVKKFFPPVLLWVISVLLSLAFGNMYVITEDSKQSIFFVIFWLFVGSVITMFFISIVNLFKDKIGKLYNVFCYFIFGIWVLGLVTVIYLHFFN